MKRYKYVFRGRVQGVGFRFTAMRYASGLGLTGWVKNMFDGSVQMEVQGDDKTIKRLLDYLNQDRYIRIESFDKTEIPTVKHESGFGLKGGY